MDKQLKIARRPAWSDLPVFDQGLLSHHTMDDEALAHEILALFGEQLQRLLKARWQELDLAFEMHTLRGAAAAVGAMQIEALSRDWRELGPDVEPAVKDAIRRFWKAARL